MDACSRIEGGGGSVRGRDLRDVKGDGDQADGAREAILRKGDSGDESWRRKI